MRDGETVGGCAAAQTQVVAAHTPRIEEEAARDLEHRNSRAAVENALGAVVVGDAARGGEKAAAAVLLDAGWVEGLGGGVMEEVARGTRAAGVAAAAQRTEAVAEEDGGSAGADREGGRGRVNANGVGRTGERERKTAVFESPCPYLHATTVRSYYLSLRARGSCGAVKVLSRPQPRQAE